jgi:pyridinium-3,5-bisthiocarboxylic acid mononucleotide nickel chelatase
MKKGCAGQLETAFRTIHVKVAGGDGLDEHAAPEYEDCRRAAEAQGMPPRKVYAAALAAFDAQRSKK